MTGQPILEARGLEKHFEQRSGLTDLVLRRRADTIHAVDKVDLALHKNESVAVIGESGCGKTTLLLTLMGLHSPSGGEIFFKGEPLSEFGRRDWKQYRSNVQVIFQDPFNSLDPKQNVREVLSEPLKIHGRDNREERLLDTLELVELEPPEAYLSRTPNQLSGGERQRVSIARALVIDPEVLLADEPVSMLDVSTQAAILNTLSNLVEELDLSLLYISHDLSTVSYVCQTINVMYLGRVIESAPTAELLEEPHHPYAQALINAVPIPDPHHHRERTRLSGAPGNPVNLGDGCRFRDRCPERMDICDVTPEYRSIEGSHKVACHLYYDHEIDGNKRRNPEVTDLS